MKKFIFSDVLSAYQLQRHAALKQLNQKSTMIRSVKCVVTKQDLGESNVSEKNNIKSYALILEHSIYSEKLGTLQKLLRRS